MGQEIGLGRAGTDTIGAYVAKLAGYLEEDSAAGIQKVTAFFLNVSLNPDKRIMRREVLTKEAKELLLYAPDRYNNLLERARERDKRYAQRRRAKTVIESEQKVVGYYQDAFLCPFDNLMLTPDEGIDFSQINLGYFKFSPDSDDIKPRLGASQFGDTSGLFFDDVDISHTKLTQEQLNQCAGCKGADLSPGLVVMPYIDWADADADPLWKALKSLSDYAKKIPEGHAKRSQIERFCESYMSKIKGPQAEKANFSSISGEDKKTFVAQVLELEAKTKKKRNRGYLVKEGLCILGLGVVFYLVLGAIKKYRGGSFTFCSEPGSDRRLKAVKNATPHYDQLIALVIREKRANAAEVDSEQWRLDN